jgi:hypothetical protein
MRSAEKSDDEEGAAPSHGRVAKLLDYAQAPCGALLFVDADTHMVAGIQSFTGHDAVGRGGQEPAHVRAL